MDDGLAGRIIMTNSAQHRGWIADVASAALALRVMLVFGVSAAQSAQAQIFTVLHAFKGGTNGAYPCADVMMHAAGNLYGTSSAGG
jgi:hypothetical protein